MSDIKPDGWREFSGNNCSDGDEFLMETLADATINSLVCLINDSVTELDINRS